jgi:microcystin degradation protein MlrC
MTRIALAQINQESDTHNPVLTTLEAFEQGGLYFGAEILEQLRGVGRIGGFLSVAEQQPDPPGPIELVPIVRARSMPGGPLAAETLEFLKDKLVFGLADAQPFDAVFLALHGASASEEIDDVEGYLLQAVRDVIGDRIPLVVALDHHANITQLIVDRADILVGHETQPHYQYGTGVKAAKALFAWLGGEFSPTLGWQKIPMITPQDQFLTSGGPMKEWFDLAREIETRPGVISASTFPMQPWLDVEEGGWSAVVYTDDDPELAQTLAVELAGKAWELREAFWFSERLSPEEAIRQAEAAPKGLIILSDTGDSAYGGASGDSTCLLKEMLHQHIQSIAFLPMVDPEAVETAMAAGVGSELTLAVGGKWDNVFSQPLTVSGQVTALSRGLKIKSDSFFGVADLGRTALLEIGSIKLVLADRRSFGLSQPIMYTHLGLDVDDAKMVVVKTASNFQFFDSWRQGLIRVDSPGMTQSDLTAFNWTHLPRPIYPLDDLEKWRAQA